MPASPTTRTYRSVPTAGARSAPTAPGPTSLALLALGSVGLPARRRECPGFTTETEPIRQATGRRVKPACRLFLAARPRRRRQALQRYRPHALRNSRVRLVFSQVKFLPLRPK